MIQLILSARLLLQRKARRQVPCDHRAREAAGRERARAARLPRRDARRHAATSKANAAASDPAAAAKAAEARVIDAAVSPLAGYTRDVPLRVQVAAGWKPGGAPSAAIWVVGEIGSAALIGDAWSEGFEATATLGTASDETVATGRAAVHAARGHSGSRSPRRRRSSPATTCCAWPRGRPARGRVRRARPHG